MITISVVILIVWVHFVADFLFQTDWMAINKSDKLLALSLHGLIYTACFLMFGLKFAIINGVLHIVVDSITSQATKHYYEINNRHAFFIVIGLDQAIHLSILVSAYILLK